MPHSDAPAADGVHLFPVDIAPYKKGNRGVDYVTTLDSGRPGPHLMINAVTHGNELCGVHALDFLFRHEVRPTRGKLTLSMANVEAYLSFDAEHPYASRFVDEDFNRLWNEETLDGDRDSQELRRARALRPIVDEIDHMLDIHSVELPQEPMLLAGTKPKGRALAEGLGMPRYVVMDAGHAAGKRLRDYARFDDPAAPNAAMLVECGYHFYEEAASIAIQTSLRFLRHHDAVPQGFLERHLDPAPQPDQVFVEVSGPITIETDDFRFARTFAAYEVVPEEGTLIGHDGETEVRTPYPDCVMVMPTREPEKGKTAVRLGRMV